MKAQTTQRSYARSQQRIQTIRARDQARAQSSQLSDIEELAEAGQMEFGENYVQELCGKYEPVDLECQIENQKQF